MTCPFQDYTYEYEDDDNLLSTFSVDLFADEEVRDALRLNGDVKRIHKIRWWTWLAYFIDNSDGLEFPTQIVINKLQGSGFNN